MSRPADYLEILGRRGRDRITGFAGVVTSISFDLYGCIQIVLSPPADDKGVVPDGRWFDFARIEADGVRVMEPPPQWLATKGAADKPARQF